MVTEQIANLSTRKCRPGSSPGLSAFARQKPGYGGLVCQKVLEIPSCCIIGGTLVGICFLEFEYSLFGV